MPRLVEMVTEGLITCQEVEVVTYGHRELRRLPAAAPVSSIMSREVARVTPDTPVAQAVSLLLKKTYRTLPVVDSEHRVVGILTDGDLLRRAHLLATSAQRELTDAEIDATLAELRAGGATVGDFMTPDPVTVTADITVAEAVRLMTDRGIKRIPVIDREARLIGIVSRLDVLRALSQPPVRELPEPAPRPGQHTRVADVMLTDVPAVPADAPLNRIVDLLVTSGQRRVMVVDGEKRVLGIITDGDLLHRAAEPARSGLLQVLTARLPAGSKGSLALGRQTAADVMTHDPAVVHVGTPLMQALRVLLERKIKRLPVVDDAGRLVGLVGRTEILQALAKDLSGD